MTSSTQNNPFSKLLVCMAVVSLVGIYSCNDSATTEKEVTPPVTTDTTMNATDTAMRMGTDTGAMKMSTGTAASDTGGKGGQPTPPGHATSSATGSAEQPH
ncbi:MAG: hypothetical protein ABIN94_18960 [Ferruginibacter sp.]